MHDTSQLGLGSRNHIFLRHIDEYAPITARTVSVSDFNTDLILQKHALFPSTVRLAYCILHRVHTGQEKKWLGFSHLS